MLARDLTEGTSVRFPLLVVVALVAIAGLADAGPAEDFSIPVGAAPAPDQACGWDVTPPPGPTTPHPAIRIDGDDPNEPATLATAPAADQPLYRPGSGIVAGNGTAQNPYLIAGWHLPRLKIKNTDAHFVVADNRFDARMAVVPGIDPDADPLPSVIPRFVDRTTWIVEAPNVSVVGNTGSPLIEVGQSPGACIADNRFAPQSIPGLDGQAHPWMHVCRSPGTQVVDNDGLWRLEIGSRHLRVAGNAFTEGILLEGRPCHVRLHQGLPPPPQPAFFDHTIPPTNTANGQPLRYLNGAANVTVGPPAGQVLLHNTTNATVQDVAILDEPEQSVDDLTTAFSRNVTVRNVTTEDVDRVRVITSPNTTINGSHFKENQIWIKRSPNVTLRDNLVNGTYELTFARSPDAVFAENRMVEFSKLVLKRGSDRTTVVRNNFSSPASPYGPPLMNVKDSDNVRVRNNTIDNFPQAVKTFPGVHGLVVTDNRFTITSSGVELEDATGTLNVSHNLFVGSGDEAPGGVFTTDEPAEVIVEANRFQDLDDDAIQVQREAPIASIQGNNFGEGVESGVRADEPVDATHNWWGCPDGPSDPDCADTTGPVTVDPWLTSPNPDAGPRTG